MATLGSLRLDLGVNLASFTSDMGRAAQITERSMRKISGLAKQAQGILGTIGVGFSLKAVLDATIEAENVQRQLETRIKSTGAVAGFSSSQLLDYAQSLSDVSTFSDEAIAKGETLLLTFTNIRGKAFTETTQAALDLSAATGDDLTSSFDKLAKAVNAPAKGFKSLRELGIVFTADQQKLIERLTKTGDVMGAQQIILDEIKVRYAGAADAAANTFGGALTQLKNHLGDLLEAHGGLPEATEKIKGFTELVKDPQTKAAADALFSGLIARIADVVSGYTKLINLFSSGFGDAGSRLKGIIPLTPIEKLRGEVAGLQEQLADTHIHSTSYFLTVSKQLTEKAQLLKDLERKAAVKVTPPAAAPGGPPVPGKFSPAPAQTTTADVDKLIAKHDAAVKSLSAVNAGLVQQAKAFDLDGAALIRARLEVGDLADELLAAGKDGEEFKSKIIASADALQKLEDAKTVKDAIAGVDEQLAQLAGNPVQAALLAFDKSFEETGKAITRLGDATARAKVEQLRGLVEEQAQLNVITDEAGRIQERLALAENRITRSREAGAISEFGQLQQIGAEREKSVALLQQEYDKYQAMIDAHGGGTQQQLIDLARLHDAIEALQSTTDLLAQKFNTIFKDSFADAFGDVITGTKSVSDAFRSMGEAIVKEIARIAAQEIATKIFGQQAGGGGGLGGLLSGVLGIFGGVSGAGAGGGFSNFSMGGTTLGYADGGRPMMGRPMMVGERGRELWWPDTAGTVIPNHALAQQAANDVTVNLIESTTKAGQVSRRRSGGKDEIDVYVSDIRGGGDRARVLENTYGLTRVGT